jgi:hypothetical protein
LTATIGEAEYDQRVKECKPKSGMLKGKTFTWYCRAKEAGNELLVLDKKEKKIFGLP